MNGVKQVIWVAFQVMATLTGVLLLWQFRAVLLLFIASLAIAAIVRPGVDYLTGRGVGRGLAIGLVYFVSLLTLFSLSLLIARPLGLELETMSEAFTAAYEHALTVWPQGTPFQQTLVERMPQTEVLFAAITGERGAELAGTLFGVAQGFFSALGQFGIAVILSIYWSVDKVRFERLWLSLLAARQREGARAIWRAIETGVGAYLRSELLQSLLAGLLLWLGYRLIGLPYPVTLAFGGALLWLIPWLGAVLAIIAPVLAAYPDPGAMAAAGVYTLLILLLLEVVVEPRLFNRRRYSSLLIVIVVVVMTQAYGLLGILIAPPLAAALQIFFSGTLRLSSGSERVVPDLQLTQLRMRLEQLQAEISAAETPPTPEVQNLLQRLTALVAEADGYFAAPDLPPGATSLPPGYMLRE